MKIFVKNYLNRIKFTGKINNDLKTLSKLHKNHLYYIPFENLDIHTNKKIILSKKHLTKKIFNNNRGGYCYELNGMFYILLKELGFKAKMISARVSNGKGGWGEEFDHMAILVELDEIWLADIGFGDSFIEPVKFELDIIQNNLNGYFKIEKYDDEYYKLMKSTDGKEFTDEYIFTLKERNWDEFEEMNNFHQTSPESHFTQKIICTIAKRNGRVTLTNNKLIITKGDRKFIKEIKDENNFNEKLYKYFGIKL